MMQYKVGKKTPQSTQSSQSSSMTTSPLKFFNLTPRPKDFKTKIDLEFERIQLEEYMQDKQLSDNIL